MVSTRGNSSFIVAGASQGYMGGPILRRRRFCTAETTSSSLNSLKLLGGQDRGSRTSGNRVWHKRTRGVVDVLYSRCALYTSFHIQIKSWIGHDAKSETFVGEEQEVFLHDGIG
ncbi:hypothetical protein PAXRUDRAFT_493369 [Paxillus rubicundulus Ve08.2h10]|uniref:Uncharacterized protein n=1 Tax=Paxillus rubicundulus Ve08.2h10 TaxID=930991 RepID=A0A0D0DDD0_9AGAM|nr:hypothetical protein PAXRUDRAFT_493369 [Paxillus rubicundulus Ve08.2h10]